MSKFQIILIGLFGFFIVGGLLIFSAYKGNTSSEFPALVVWGTLDQTSMSAFFQNVVFKSNNNYKVTYVQKRAETMYTQYTEALIAGRGPDILLLPHEELLKYQNKMTVIPYTAFSEKEFKSTYIQEGELYLLSKGILALPFSVDPLVMYWNRDLFNNAQISTPPRYWQDLLTVSGKITTKDTTRNIVRSGAGLGEYRNVDHAKELVSLLFMQSGTPITARRGDTVDNYITASETGVSPSVSALSFYTQFANSTSEVYAWNRSLPSSKTFFISNKLGVYFGYGSENSQLRALNPNLNYDITVIPQVRPTANTLPINITYGKMYGLSISGGSKNINAALELMRFMTSAPILQSWVAQSGLGSVRLDALSNSGSSASSVIGTSALWSRGWLDPDPVKTSVIFQTMVEGVTSRRTTAANAVGTAGSQLQNILNP